MQISISFDIFSPTTEPIDPPIKSKSMQAKQIESLPIFPMPVFIASSKPDFFVAFFSLWEYEILSSKLRGSIDFISLNSSVNDFFSQIIFM